MPHRNHLRWKRTLERFRQNCIRCSHGPAGRLCCYEELRRPEPATGRWLVSWQLSGCAAKQSGCQILPVADADQGSSSRCSGIGSRTVISNSNSYWSDQVAALLWGHAAWPARIYKQELFNL
jgi:hypothetical protein